MSILDWLRPRDGQSDGHDQSLAWSKDDGLIERNVPELGDMSDAEAMEHTRSALFEWMQTASESQRDEFGKRLSHWNESFQSHGYFMPFWVNLWVLRSLQAELGQNAPAVSESL